MAFIHQDFDRTQRPAFVWSVGHVGGLRAYSVMAETAKIAALAYVARLVHESNPPPHNKVWTVSRLGQRAFPLVNETKNSITRWLLEGYVKPQPADWGGKPGDPVPDILLPPRVKAINASVSSLQPVVG